MLYVLVHGSFSTIDQAWFPWIAGEVRNLGYNFLSPQFPVDKWNDVNNLEKYKYIPKQSLNSWYRTFESQVIPYIGNQELCFIGHSTGPLFILHAIVKYSLQVDRAYFIAPFLKNTSKSDIVNIANRTFIDEKPDLQKANELIRDSVVFYSDNDPYVDNINSIQFANALGSVLIKLNGLGHMGIESNMDKFPELLKVIINSK